MKNYFKLFPVVFLLVLLIAGCHTPDNNTSKTMTDRFLLANTHQLGSGYWFAAIGDSIYRFGPTSADGLSRLDGDTFSPVSTEADELFVNSLPAGFSGDLFYFWRRNSNDAQSKEDLFCYSIKENKAVETGIRRKKKENAITFFAPDGSLHVSISGSNERYYVLKQGSAAEEECEQDRYLLGELQFCLKHSVGKASELYEGSNGEERQIELPWADKRYLLPVEDGLIVCNKGGEHLLYLISPSGEIKELFSIPCMISEAAITVYGDYVFLSVERWEKSGSLGMLHYEDDQLQGSYRINWKTGETIRFSGDLYKGLFILYEDCIIGSDEHGHIVLLDHEFHVLQQLK